MAKKIKESDIRRQIRDYLRLTGWFVYHNLQGLGCYLGLSDLVAMKDGRVVYIEIKTPRGRQSDPQKQFQRDVETAGGEYLVARSLDDVMDL